MPKGKVKILEKHKLISKQVGYNLRTMRLVKRLSSVDVENLTGIARQRIIGYETGRVGISVSILLDLAKLYDTPIQDFFNGIDIK